jgi:hypothetical protein
VPFAFVKNFVETAFLPQWPLIYDFIYFSSPPVANISGENVLDALFILKVPLETAPSPNFFMLPTPLRLRTLPRHDKTCKQTILIVQKKEYFNNFTFFKFKNPKFVRVVYSPSNKRHTYSQKCGASSKN